MACKYDGLILEGRWQFKKYNSSNAYEFENIYNHTTIVLSQRQVENVITGRITIGQIITKRIPTSSFGYKNNIQKAYAKQVRKYNK